MAVRHKNKSFATFLALVLGGLGIHRFYLYGGKDPWGWLHLSTVPISALVLASAPGQPLLFVASPLVVSALIGFIETLVIGLTPDDRWDAAHNPGSGRQSDTGWPIAVLLVLTLGIGTTALIATLARTVDLLFTGGAYG
jgi:TM2 domain-containing membrane protein YozV